MAKQIIQTREIEAYEKQKKALIIKVQKAEDFRVTHLQKILFRNLKKNIQLMKVERQIEQEHEARKNQIDEFFNNLRNKATQDKEQDQIEENKVKLQQELKQAAKEKLKHVKKLEKDLKKAQQQDLDDSLPITPFKEFTENLEKQNQLKINLDQQDLFVR